MDDQIAELEGPTTGKTMTDDLNEALGEERRFVRCIVPGRNEQSKRAELRGVVVERTSGEGPLTLGSLAIKKAERGKFVPIYSSLYVLIERPDDPFFDALWKILNTAPEERFILATIYQDEHTHQVTGIYPTGDFMIPGWNLDYELRTSYTHTGPPEATPEPEGEILTEDIP